MQAWPSCPADGTWGSFIRLLWVSQVGESEDWDAANDHYQQTLGQVFQPLTCMQILLTLKCTSPFTGVWDRACVSPKRLGDVDAGDLRHILSSKGLGFYLLPFYPQLGYVILPKEYGRSETQLLAS